MSNVHGLTVENLMSTFPDYMRKDEMILALAESIAEKLGALPKQIDSIRIYAMIDDLPEELLDILAYDFKVDWWDPNYTLEQKRQTLKESWNVHRALGTKHAVETAMSAVYNDTYVSEWYQYDGDPFHFTLHIDATFENPDPVKHQRVLDRLEYYKNLRSSPYYIEYSARPYGNCTTYMGAAVSCFGGHMTVNVEV